MAFYDFLKKPQVQVDPALKKLLQERGMTETLANLEKTAGAAQKTAGAARTPSSFGITPKMTSALTSPAPSTLNAASMLPPRQEATPTIPSPSRELPATIAPPTAAPTPTITPTVTPNVPAPSAVVAPAPPTSPQTTFTGLMTDLLKKYQETTPTANLEVQRRTLLKAMYGKQAEITPEELRVLSPQQQDAIRSGNVSALQPDLDLLNNTITQQGAKETQFLATIDKLSSLEKASKADQRQARSDIIEIIGKYGDLGLTSEELKALSSGGDISVDLISRIGKKVDKQLAEKNLPTTPSSYTEWTLAGSPGTYADWVKKTSSTGMSPSQTSTFTSITNNAMKSPLIAANDRAVILRAVTDQIMKDPTNAALQVTFIYAMIQALDTYQSAVREGEIGLISGTQGLGDQLSNIIPKVEKGNPLSKNKVEEYVGVSKLLIDSMAAAAAKKRKEYEAVANAAGVGDAWREYSTALDALGNVGETAQQGADEFELNGIKYVNDGTGNYILKTNDLSRSGKGSSQVALSVKLPTGQTNQGGSASWRNNNPLNIKYGSFSQKYGASKGSKATDNGNFATFPSVNTGLKAARDLLRGSTYAGLPLEKAMRKWSGNGYGSDVAPANIRGKTTGQMTDAELNSLIQSMMKREGWTTGTIIA